MELKRTRACHEWLRCKGGGPWKLSLQTKISRTRHLRPTLPCSKAQCLLTLTGSIHSWIQVMYFLKAFEGCLLIDLLPDFA